MYTDLLVTQWKLYFFLAPFQSRINSVYQQQQQNADCEKLFYHWYPSHTTKFRVLTAQWHFNKSFHPFTPFKVDFIFQWILLSYIIAVHKTYTIDMVLIHSEIKMSDLSRIAWVKMSSSSFAFLRRFLQYVTSLTEPNNPQQLGFLLSDDG